MRAFETAGISQLTCVLHFFCIQNISVTLLQNQPKMNSRNSLFEKLFESFESTCLLKKRKSQRELEDNIHKYYTGIKRDNIRQAAVIWKSFLGTLIYIPPFMILRPFPLRVLTVHSSSRHRHQPHLIHLIRLPSRRVKFQLEKLLLPNRVHLQTRLTWSRL